MNSDRIKEIQQETAYPESRSVQQALLKVWNETEQSLKSGHVETLVSVRDYLRQIQGSRKGSIGSINNTYLPQLNVRRLDDLLEKLNECIGEAH